MRPKTPPPCGDLDIDRDDFDEERSRETERMLIAIARAIATSRLPPDDAFAWARIAASQVKAEWMRAAGDLVGQSTTH